MTSRRALVWVAPALASLRDRRGATLLVSLLGAAALGLVLAGRWLAGQAPGGVPALRLPEIATAGPALMWTAGAQAPAVTQARAAGELLQLLSALTWVGFGVAGLSILSCYAAQARDRAAELGIRRAVGSSRRGTLASLLFEGAVLALIALVIGVALAGILRAVALHWWPGAVAELAAAGPLPALAVCAVLGAASLTPLWKMRARDLLDPADQDVGLRIPAFQVAVSIALLLASATLLTASRLDPRAGPSGPGPAGTLLRVESGDADGAARAAGYDDLVHRLAGTPGIELASLSSGGALLGLGTLDEVTTDCGACPFGGIVIRWPHFTALAHAVSPDSFRALGLGALQGRLLETGDTPRARRVAVVNRQLALRYFQGGAAVGRDIYLGPGWPAVPYRVVGVVGDERSPFLGGASQPRETVYLSVLQLPPRRVDLLLRFSGAGASAGVPALIRRVLGPGASIGAAEEASRAAQVQRDAIRWFGMGLGVAAGLLLLMALAGSYFTLRAWAESVRWEISLRRALGARRRRMLGWVVARAALMGLGGAGLGCFLYAAVLAEALRGTLGRMPPANPQLLAVALIPMLLAVLAGVLPGLAVVRRPPGPSLH